MAERRDLAGVWTGLLAALIVLGPSVAPGRLIGDEGLDVWSHVWGEGWVGRSLLSGHLPWRDHGLAWPDGGVLWYIDPLGAMVALPFVALSLGALGHLAVQVAQIALAAVAGRALGRALGGSGWVSGIGLATTPFLLGELHNGITEASWLGLVPAAGAAAARGEGALIVVPVLKSPLTCRWQGLVHRPLLGGMVEEQPWAWPAAFRAFVEGNTLLMDLWALGEGQDRAVSAYTADLEALRAAGFTGVLLDMESWSRVPAARGVPVLERLTGALGDPDFADPSGALWQIHPDGLSGEPPPPEAHLPEP